MTYEGFIVVCADGHAAEGLYRSEDEAIRARDIIQGVGRDVGLTCKYMIVKAEINLSEFLS